MLAGWCKAQLQISKTKVLPNGSILSKAKEIMNKRGMILKSKNGMPSKKWLKSWKREYGKGAFKTAKATAIQRTDEARLRGTYMHSHMRALL